MFSESLRAPVSNLAWRIYIRVYRSQKFPAEKNKGKEFVP